MGVLVCGFLLYLDFVLFHFFSPFRLNSQPAQHIDNMGTEVSPLCRSKRGDLLRNNDLGPKHEVPLVL